jgi:hypothetical protein
LVDPAVQSQCSLKQLAVMQIEPLAAGSRTGGEREVLEDPGIALAAPLHAVVNATGAITDHSHSGSLSPYRLVVEEHREDLVKFGKFTASAAIHQIAQSAGGPWPVGRRSMVACRDLATPTMP